MSFSKIGQIKVTLKLHDIISEKILGSKNSSTDNKIKVGDDVDNDAAVTTWNSSEEPLLLIILAETLSNIRLLLKTNGTLILGIFV